MHAERNRGNDLSPIPAKDVAKYPADYLARVSLSEQLNKQISSRKEHFSWIRFDDDGTCYVRKEKLINMLHTFEVKVFFEQDKEVTDLFYSNDELTVRVNGGESFTVSGEAALTWHYHDNAMAFYPLTGEIQKNGQRYLAEASEVIDSRVEYQGYTLENISGILDLKITFDKRTGLLSIQE